MMKNVPLKQLNKSTAHNSLTVYVLHFLQIKVIQYTVSNLKY